MIEVCNNNFKEICIRLYESPSTMQRHPIIGKPMLDISNAKFEQVIRDELKMKSIVPYEVAVRVDIQYGTDKQLYIVDVAKAILDGLNRYAYIDDNLVKAFTVSKYPKGGDIRLLISTFNDNSDYQELSIPVNPVAKQEPHPQLYLGREIKNELLYSQLEKTSKRILQECNYRLPRDTLVSLKINVFSKHIRADIDNIAKYYVEALILAGVIEKTNICHITSEIYQDDEEGVMIQICESLNDLKSSKIK